MAVAIWPAVNKMGVTAGGRGGGLVPEREVPDGVACQMLPAGEAERKRRTEGEQDDMNLAAAGLSTPPSIWRPNGGRPWRTLGPSKKGPIRRRLIPVLDPDTSRDGRIRTRNGDAVSLRDLERHSPGPLQNLPIDLLWFTTPPRGLCRPTASGVL